MADGSAMRAHPAPDSKPLGLDEAIRLLEAGQGQDICVDLGDGRLARADGPRGSEGLLQRLLRIPSVSGTKPVSCPCLQVSVAADRVPSLHPNHFNIPGDGIALKSLNRPLWNQRAIFWSDPAQ